MSRRTFTWVAIACSGIGLFGLLSFMATARIWDGGWRQEEFRITFQDRDGNPVKGVQLRVENESGSRFYHFPVTDYLPDRIPTSDGDGVIVFHHAPASGVSGHAWWLFGFIPMGEHGSPVYVCRFLHRGQEVYHIRYNDLVNTGETTVRRRWRWLTWPELQEHVFQGVEWDETEPSRLRIFDLNKNGHLERDERYAAGAAYRAAYRAQDRAFDIKAGLKREWEELEFRLVERTVVLELP